MVRQQHLHRDRIFGGKLNIIDRSRANASKLLLITTKVKNQREMLIFSFDLFSPTQSDVYDGL
ncbi:hypothetical protein [Nostoc sp.]|uniref:hypothetical protein n=1 Tax=Nostoc sp. TaxID=1180 RepID=UPI002FF7DD9B